MVSKCNKINIIILLMCMTSFVFAFDNPIVWQPSYYRHPERAMSRHELTGNPASLIYYGNQQLYRVSGVHADQSYRRLFDPASIRSIQAIYTTLRKINERSFFYTGIMYEDIHHRGLFGSMEKDFYNDYFSMTDSTTGNTAYYGPQLQILYNAELAKDLFFGFEGKYGVERGLKDTFPQTITIMRNSDYHLGLEYRKPSFSLGLTARYYDDQNHYEAVRKYTEVEPKTYFGYNVYYNELPASTAKKKRTRNGIEYGGHLGFGKKMGVSGLFSISGIHRISRADAIRGSYTRPRGLWQRQGMHINTIINIYPESITGLRIYGDYLKYEDWGASMISNTLVLENRERYWRLGSILVYKPSLAQQIFVGMEARHVAYDYEEYIFSFHDVRSGWEWKGTAGTSIYISGKTRMMLDLTYEKEIPRFYWGTGSFENILMKITLEQLFSFGYISLDIENINKKPENNLETLNIIMGGLSFRQR